MTETELRRDNMRGKAVWQATENLQEVQAASSVALI